MDITILTSAGAVRSHGVDCIQRYWETTGGILGVKGYFSLNPSNAPASHMGLFVSPPTIQSDWPCVELQGLGQGLGYDGGSHHNIKLHRTQHYKGIVLRPRFSPAAKSSMCESIELAKP